MNDGRIMQVQGNRARALFKKNAAWKRTGRTSNIAGKREQPLAVSYAGTEGLVGSPRLASSLCD
jgi:hypothetical protein